MAAQGLNVLLPSSRGSNAAGSSTCSRPSAACVVRRSNKFFLITAIHIPSQPLRNKGLVGSKKIGPLVGEQPQEEAVTSTWTTKNSSSSSRVSSSLTPEKLQDMFKSLEGWAEKNILSYLKPVEKSWQPQDFLPDPSSPLESFFEELREVRRAVEGISDELLVCLIGNMITEEALPTYQSMLNTFEGVRDTTGSSETPWARWSRRWTAEENRHGDLLNRYLYFTGRVNMRQVEKTIQYLIGSGMDIQTESSPHHGFIYTSFQERATFISHGNTARHAKRHGDASLAKICGSVAADERRHELAYTKIVEKLFEVDPNTTMLALADMMRKRITMPAHRMFDGQDRNLFLNYSAIAQRIGVYTTKDYVDNVDFFVDRWKVGEIDSGLTGEGRRAQDFVCGFAQRIRKMEERALERTLKMNKDDAMSPFTWIICNRNRNVAK